MLSWKRIVGFKNTSDAVGMLEATWNFKEAEDQQVA